MDDAAKLIKLKNQLNITDSSCDAKLLDYLDSAKTEILNWMYVNRGEVPADLSMPTKYDVVQIQSVVTGYNLEGTENEIVRIENGIDSHFQYPNMIEFIHDHVNQYPG